MSDRTIPITPNVSHYVQASSQRHSLAAVFLWKELLLPTELGPGWATEPTRNRISVVERIASYSNKR
jgi:hypothetical protein